MIDLKQIKLIIWDLDETLWNGTLSEGKVVLKSDIVNFIENTLDMGIVHSICSKNDYKCAKQQLLKFKIWDYFVFPSINWEPKGERIKEIISNMGFRPVNVLFVDDNIQNLREAQYFLPQINVLSPYELLPIFQCAKQAEKKDKEHKRLSQYQLLQKKFENSKTYANNEEFLYSCNIHVDIFHDCLSHADRLYELIIRSNQLNYTKSRPSKEDFLTQLSDKNIQSGYVRVKDKFGDYGIVGFYAVKNWQLVHYVFSCRTLGMRVEQYVYMILKCPRVKIEGEVVSQLNEKEIPGWINNTSFNGVNQSKSLKAKILLKGPCDMQQIFSFIRDDEKICGEFSYTNERGILTEGHNNTAQIVTAIEGTDQEKNSILKEFDWLDKNCLTTSITTCEYDFIVLSMLTDGNLGIYKNKENGRLISLCEKYYDLTDKKNWDLYINKKIFTSNINFTQDDLTRFANEYEYVKNDNFQITINCLEKISTYLDKKTKLILLLGSEREYKGKVKPSYENRHLLHKLLNDKIKQWSINKNNVILIGFDEFIDSQSCFLDSINHFVKKVYYELAEKIIGIINESGSNLKVTGHIDLLFKSFKQKLRLLKKKIFSK